MTVPTDWIDARGRVVVSGTLNATARLRWSWDVRPKGWLRVLGPVIGWQWGRREERIWTGLKEHLEASEGATLADPDDGTIA